MSRCNGIKFLSVRVRQRLRYDRLIVKNWSIGLQCVLSYRVFLIFSILLGLYYYVKARISAEDVTTNKQHDKNVGKKKKFYLNNTINIFFLIIYVYLLLLLHSIHTSLLFYLRFSNKVRSDFWRTREPRQTYKCCCSVRLYTRITIWYIIQHRAVLHYNM